MPYQYPSSPTTLGDLTNITFKGWLQAIWTYIGQWGKGFQGDHYVEAYGAKGDGTTDDSVSIMNAITAAMANTNGSNTVRFGAKVYCIRSQNTINMLGGKGLCLKGMPGKVPAAGITSGFPNCSGTILLFGGNANNTMIFYTNTTSSEAANVRLVLEDISFVNDVNNVTGALGVTGDGVNLGWTGTEWGGSISTVIRNCGFYQFPGNQFIVWNARSIEFDNSTFVQNGSTGGSCVVIAAEGGRFCGDMTFTACTLIGTGQAGSKTLSIKALASGAQVRGLHFTDTIIYYGNYAVFMDCGIAANTQMQDIFFDHCALDGITGGGAGSIQTAFTAYASGNNTVVNNIQITDCYAVSWPIRGVDFYNFGGGCLFNNIKIQGNYWGNIQSYVIVIQGTTTTGTMEGVHISNNRMADCGGGGGNMGIYLGNNVRDVVINMNTHVTSGNPAPASGLGNLISLNGDCDWILVNNNMGKAATAVANATTGVNIGLYNNFAH